MERDYIIEHTYGISKEDFVAFLEAVQRGDRTRNAGTIAPSADGGPAMTRWTRTGFPLPREWRKKKEAAGFAARRPISRSYILRITSEKTNAMNATPITRTPSRVFPKTNNKAATTAKIPGKLRVSTLNLNNVGTSELTHPIRQAIDRSHLDNGTRNWYSFTWIFY